MQITTLLLYYITSAYGQYQPFVSLWQGDPGQLISVAVDSGSRVIYQAFSTGNNSIQTKLLSIGSTDAAIITSTYGLYGSIYLPASQPSASSFFSLRPADASSSTGFPYAQKLNLLRPSPFKISGIDTATLPRNTGDTMTVNFIQGIPNSGVFGDLVVYGGCLNEKFMLTAVNLANIVNSVAQFTWPVISGSSFPSVTSCLHSIAVDTSGGYVYAIGQSSGTINGVSGNGGVDLMVTKHFLSNGSMANLTIQGSNQDDNGWALALDPSGSFLYVGGQASGNVNGQQFMMSSSGGDAAGSCQLLIKLRTSDLSVQWTRLFRTAPVEYQSESVQTVSVHSVSGDIFVSGRLISNAGGQDLSMTVFSAAGQRLMQIKDGSAGVDSITQAVRAAGDSSSLLLAAQWNGMQQLLSFQPLNSLTVQLSSTQLNTSGGELLQITLDSLFNPHPFNGAGFRVLIGGRECTAIGDTSPLRAAIAVVGDNSIYCQTPPGVGANVSVQIELLGYAQASATISYAPAQLLSITDPLVFVYGQDLLILEVANLGVFGLEVTAITVGSQPCTNVSLLSTSLNSSANISCLTPALAPGQYEVVLAVGGQNAAQRFNVTYLLPSILSVSPLNGSISGGKTLNFSVQGMSKCTPDNQCLIQAFFNETQSPNVQLLQLPGGSNVLTVQSPAINASSSDLIMPTTLRLQAGSYSLSTGSVFNYITPLINTVTPLNLSVNGGQWLQLRGVGLGRQCFSQSDCSAFLQVSVGYWQCADLRVNADETAIQCLTQPGVGVDLNVKVSLRTASSQWFPIIVSTTVYYQPPSIRGISPTISFQNDTILTVTGGNLGCNYTTISGKLVELPGSGNGNYFLEISSWLNSSAVQFRVPASLNIPIALYKVELSVGGQVVTWSGNHRVTQLPTANQLQSNALEGITQTVALSGSALPGQTISYAVFNSSNDNYLKLTAPKAPNITWTLSFTPPTDFYGLFTVFYVAIITVDSFRGISIPAPVDFFVNLINKPPYFPPDYTGISPAYDVPEDGQSAAKLILQATDRENQTMLTYQLLSLPSVGILLDSSMQRIDPLSLPLVITANPSSNATLFYIPPLPAKRGLVTFNWTCWDPYNVTLIGSFATMSIDIRYSPTASGGSMLTQRYADNQNITLDATIVSGDRLKINITVPPANGTLTGYDGFGQTFQLGAANGETILPVGVQVVAYRPRRFFYGQDQFQFQALSEDGVMLSPTVGTVSITVSFVNLPPNFTDPSAVFLLNDDDSQSANVKLPIYDEDENNNLTVIFHGEPQRGQWFSNATGTVQPFQISSGVRLFTAYDAFSSTNITIPDAFSFFMKHDNKGGARAYTNVSYSAVDSLGTPAKTNGTFNIKVQCATNRVNNFWRTVGQFCAACPTGAQCSDDGEYYPVNKPGYYPTDNFEFLECAPSEACPAGNISASRDAYQSNAQFTCAEGYAGLRCGKCSPNYFRRGIQCASCPVYRINPLLLGLIMFIALLIAIGVVNILRKIDVGFIGILLSYWQVMAILSTFRLQWPPALLNLFTALSAIYLNVQVVSPECFVGDDNSFTYEIKWYSTISQPVAVMIVLFMMIAASELTEVSFRTAQKRMQLVRQGRLRRKAAIKSDPGKDSHNSRNGNGGGGSRTVLRSVPMLSAAANESENGVRSPATLLSDSINTEVKSSSQPASTIKSPKPPYPLKLKRLTLTSDSTNYSKKDLIENNAAKSPEDQPKTTGSMHDGGASSSLLPSPLSGKSPTIIIDGTESNGELGGGGKKKSNEKDSGSEDDDCSDSGSSSGSDESGSDDGSDESDNDSDSDGRSTSNDSNSSSDGKSKESDKKRFFAGSRSGISESPATQMTHISMVASPTSPIRPNIWNIMSGDYDNCVRRRDEDAGANPTLSASLLGIFLLILKLVYINVSQRSLELYQCSFNANTGKWYYYSEPNRICFEDWWMRLLPFSIAGVAFYVIGIPALFIALYHMRNRYLLIPRMQRTRFQMLILQATYKKRSEFFPKTEYWDVVLLLRKLAVIGCQILFTDYIALQAITLIIIYCLFLIWHIFVMPYSMKSLNFLEGVTMLSSLMVLGCGIMFWVNDFKTESEISTLGYFVLAIIILSSLLIVLMLINHMKSLYDQFMLQRAQQKLQKKHRKHEARQRERAREEKEARKADEIRQKMLRRMQRRKERQRRNEDEMLAVYPVSTPRSRNQANRRSTANRTSGEITPPSSPHLKSRMSFESRLSPLSLSASAAADSQNEPAVLSSRPKRLTRMPSGSSANSRDNKLLASASKELRKKGGSTDLANKEASNSNQQKVSGTLSSEIPRPPSYLNMTRPPFSGSMPAETSLPQSFVTASNQPFIQPFTQPEFSPPHFTPINNRSSYMQQSDFSTPRLSAMSTPSYTPSMHQPDFSLSRFVDNQTSGAGQMQLQPVVFVPTQSNGQMQLAGGSDFSLPKFTAVNNYPYQQNYAPLPSPSQNAMAPGVALPFRPPMMMTPIVQTRTMGVTMPPPPPPAPMMCLSMSGIPPPPPPPPPPLLSISAPNSPKVRRQ